MRPGLAQQKLPQEAKCTRCRKQATLRMVSHHALFCHDCFLNYFRSSVTKAMKKFRIHPGTPLLVAVSGGKDSLALWNVLHELGYDTRGLHINLHIGGFSDDSVEAIQRFAEPRNLSWTQVSLRAVFGYSIPEIRTRTRRKICSVCGLLKRQLLNRLTLQEGFSTLAIGHNLDDEAGRLLGNMVRHRLQYLDRIHPMLPSNHPKLPVKLKPLYRVESSEIRTYCRLSGIQPLEAKCPLSRGATSHIFKEALDLLEDRMPGTKRDFLYHYIEAKKDHSHTLPFVPCSGCGEPSYDGACSVCSLKGQLDGRADTLSEKTEEQKSEDRSRKTEDRSQKSE